MLPRSQTEYDLAGLNELVSAIDGALFGRGDGGDLQQILRVEGGLLAMEISDRLGPSSKESADKKVDRDVKQFLTDRPVYSNLEEGQQYSSYADFTWLQAGQSFLVGINDEDNQTGAGAEDAIGYLRTGQKTGSRGDAYVQIGRRGYQHLLRLNRTRVSSSTLREVKRAIKGNIGVLRASFAYTASRLIPGKRIPTWISRHFPSRANDRAVFNDAGLSNRLNPFLEFGSTAKGVESNPKISQAIADAVERRKHLLKSKLQKVLAGYAYDWRNGRVFRRREAKEDED